MKPPTFLKRLGMDKTGSDLILMSDNYVYRFRGIICQGWLCSLPAWQRTLHILNIGPELIE